MKNKQQYFWKTQYHTEKMPRQQGNRSQKIEGATIRVLLFLIHLVYLLCLHRSSAWFVQPTLPRSLSSSSSFVMERRTVHSHRRACSFGADDRKRSSILLFAHRRHIDASPPTGTKDSDFLESLLNEHGFDQRMVSLTPTQLPVLAEFQENGQAQICWIQTILKADDKDGSNKQRPPKLSVQLPEGSLKTVDLGQLTTIWIEEDDQEQFRRRKELSDQLFLLEKLMDSNTQSVEEASWPVGHVESSLDQLWKLRSRVPSSGGGGLSKKQITKLVETCRDESMKDSVNQVLRQVVKAGKFYSRLVDSEDVRWACFQNQPKASPKQREITMLQRRAYAANILGADAKSGGRFKRFGCIPLPSSSTTNNEIRLINGGWLALDQNLRATSEARKFAERADSSDSSSSDYSTGTVADERIIHKLEFLAMERNSFSSSSSQAQGGGYDFDDEKSLELDVRQTLKAMELPRTSEGAKSALIRIGRWTETSSSNSRRQTAQAWPESVLSAAEWYRDMDKQRRKQIYMATRKNIENEFEGRVDLTQLPCVCVDAARASFRDDAVSVRPRASTGRNVNPNASKWEILLHIADVSDIYATKSQVKDDDGNLKILRKAAAGRGVSRYNLPSGPLHLMPPIALQSLALETINPDLTSKSSPIQGNNHDSINRCVTLWVYIDERNGKILDAGIERTIISCPLALSFDSATRLLDAPMDTDMDPILQKAKAVLGIVERNVCQWKEFHTARNEASQAREKRLAAREVVGKATYGERRSRDDGREGFIRTRGHQIVDACLELYGYALQGFLRGKNASLPRVAGTGPDRLARIATAPLRRYIDGIAQQQALAVSCRYGGKPLTKQECIEIGKDTTKVINAVNNLNSRKSGAKRPVQLSSQQRHAVKMLKQHLASRGGKSIVPAIGTGRQNEVVILGAGTVASCKGVSGTLKPGEKVMVRLLHIDEERGMVSASLAGSQSDR